MIPKKLCPCTKHEETIIRGVNQGIGRQLSKIVIINGRKVPAIIDCGANVNYVNKAWSEGIGIKAKDYGEASVKAYSGREIKERLSIASIRFSFNGKWMRHEFRVLKETGSDKVVLGIPWLREENPTIDWRKETITLIEERIKTEMVSIKGLLRQTIGATGQI
jgi:gag-polyprotein putative aspartyl protease